MGMESRYTWMDGALVPSEKATVPFLTSGLHYGLGALEGIRCYETPRGPAIFRLPEHARRLCDSARILGLEMAYDAHRIAEACVEVVRENGFRECYVRPLVFATSGGWNLSLKGVSVSVCIAAWAWSAYLGEHALQHGIRANVSSFTRHHPNVMMTKAKISGNYANSVLAKTECHRLGFDEAIMLDPSGCVAECTGANLFLVRGGKLITPPKTTILEGITRDSLLTLAAEMGYAIEEQNITRDQLYIADELFVCGTAAEVISLREVDGRPIGNGSMGPVTGALQRAFHAAARGQDERHVDWLRPVGAASTGAAGL